MNYIHTSHIWARFTWDDGLLAQRLAQVRYRQGWLAGQVERLGAAERNRLLLEVFVQDAMGTSRLAGVVHDEAALRRAAQRCFEVDGVDGGDVPVEVQGLVSFLDDARRDYGRLLTPERLRAWHDFLCKPKMAAVGRSSQPDGWRVNAKSVVVGPPGQARVVFEGIASFRLHEEMRRFVKWMNDPRSGPPVCTDPILKASLAHLWFATLLPFDDGNGRIGRVIVDRELALSEPARQRFYSMTAQICREESEYYQALRLAQRGDMEVTRWHLWFVECLERSIAAAVPMVAQMGQARQSPPVKTGPTKKLRAKANQRQSVGLSGLKTTGLCSVTLRQWIQLAGCSKATALRDINWLLKEGVLVKSQVLGKKTSYRVVEG